MNIFVIAIVVGQCHCDSVIVRTAMGIAGHISYGLMTCQKEHNANKPAKHEEMRFFHMITRCMTSASEKSQARSLQMLHLTMGQFELVEP